MADGLFGSQRAIVPHKELDWGFVSEVYLAQKYVEAVLFIFTTYIFQYRFAIGRLKALKKK